MHLLILGGGRFVGAATLDAALARGHRVTVFNRGKTRTAWPVGVDVVHGDRCRAADLDALAAGRRFDAVIDTSGYVPADVQASAAALRDGCGGRYLFVSSISAYASTSQVPLAETDPLARYAHLAPDDRDPRHYGAQKAACEAAIRAVFGAHSLIVRPGLVVGPGDPTGRFSHWPWRCAAGGAMLVPAMAETAPLQCIDVRDLGAWQVRLVENGATGVFNATGPADDGAGSLSWPALLEACRSEAVVRGFSPAAVVRVDEAFLQRAGVAPWTELPLWLPSDDADLAGFMRISTARAAAAGLVTRALRETIAAVLDEGAPPPGDPRRGAALTADREARLLADWAAASASTFTTPTIPTTPTEGPR